MIDTAKEWLESLYARNAPEADWAKDILDRLDLAEDTGEIEKLHRKCDDLEAEAEAAGRRADDAEEDLQNLLSALGADDLDEAIEMARAMRAAFTGE